MPFNPIQQETFQLEPGDGFVLFSDGVSEAMNHEEEFYGEERLLAVLSEESGATPVDTVRRVMADVRAFAAGAKQSDDITVLVARYAPAQA
jgi:sigma-B regulation protein RsbU (phosphoserine phosphatase)